MSSPSPKSLINLKTIGCLIGIAAFATIISVPFLKTLEEWSGIIMGGAVFVGMQGLILFMVATSKEEVPAISPPKRALIYYSVLDFFLWSFPLPVLFYFKLIGARLEFVFMPNVLFAAVGAGILLGYIEVRFFLAKRIKDGVIENLKEDGWLRKRLPALIAFALVVIINHGRETFCQAFLQSEAYQCFGAANLLLCGIFLGTFLMKSGWILLWEKLNQRKLYM